MKKFLFVSLCFIGIDSQASFCYSQNAKSDVAEANRPYDPAGKQPNYQAHVTECLSEKNNNYYCQLKGYRGPNWLVRLLTAYKKKYNPTCK